MIKALLYKDFNALKRYARIMLVVAVVCSFIFKEEGSSLIDIFRLFTAYNDGNR